MKTIQKRGGTIDGVLQGFMKDNNLTKRDFTYKIIQEPVKGFLGIFGAKQAILKFKIQDPDEMIEDFLNELFQLMKLEAPKVEVSKEENSYYVRIFPISDIGLLVGKDGRFIDQLQYLLNRIFEDNKVVGKVLLDVDNYRERQKEQFRARASKQISVFQAQNRKFMTMFNLDSSSRRIVHREVERIPTLRTLTIGDGKMKNVVIFNKEQASEADFKHMTFTPRERRPSNRNSRPYRNNSHSRNDNRSDSRPDNRSDNHNEGDRDRRPRHDNRNDDHRSDNRSDNRSNYRPQRSRRTYNNNSNSNAGSSHSNSD